MTDLVIKVEGLSKLYRIGAKQQRYKTLRGSIRGAVTNPLQRLRGLLPSIFHLSYYPDPKLNHLQSSAVGHHLRWVANK